MGVWIEMSFALSTAVFMPVTPFVGVWIEIHNLRSRQIHLQSLPSWECGLKYGISCEHGSRGRVTPFVGVWIEITNVWDGTYKDNGHSLRGSVD